MFAVARPLPQVVEVRNRDRCQPFVLGLAVVAILALQNAPGGRSTQCLVCFIDGSQQFETGAGVGCAKRMPPGNPGKQKS